MKFFTLNLIFENVKLKILTYILWIGTYIIARDLDFSTVQSSF